MREQGGYNDSCFQSWASDLPGDRFVDNRIYLSEEIFAQEQQKIFGKVWQQPMSEEYRLRAAHQSRTPIPPIGKDVRSI